jgi:hypothetical protein
MSGLIRAGDPFPLGSSAVGCCPAEIDYNGFLVACVLESGHGGQHVASDGEYALAVWE